MDADLILLTPIVNNLLLIDGDAVRRLHELGYQRRKPPARLLNSVPSDRSQQDFIERCYMGIRDVEHYRKLVDNPRSPGPLVRFPRGSRLLMQRTHAPTNKRAIWYVLPDTSLGCSIGFIELLLSRNHGTVEVLQERVPEFHYE